MSARTDRRHRPSAAVLLIVLPLVLAGCGGRTDEGSDPGGTERPDAPTSAIEGAPPVGADVVEPEPLGELALVTVSEHDAPIDAVALDDGTLLVAERAGRVVPVGPAGDVGAAIVDLTARTTTDGERGLLSLAVDAAEEHLVLSFTDLDGATTLESYRLLPGPSVAPGPPRALWRLDQPYANHNGGAIRFGPDGMLHLALGDGGGRDDPLDAGQDLSTPLGALVRLDVSGTGPARIPPDNPFVSTDGADPAILAIGLRNPWRFDLDAEGGDVWIADVGQGRREEITRLAIDDLAGANLGWARLEGSLPLRGEAPPDHVLPVHEYEHGPGCSVTGGVVYRGRRLPALEGAYLFSDLCDGTIRALIDDGTGGRSAIDLGVGGRQVVGFARDAEGEVLVIDLAGTVSRLVPA